MMILLSSSYPDFPSEKKTTADRNSSYSSKLQALKALRNTRTGSRYSSAGSGPLIILGTWVSDIDLNLPFFAFLPIRQAARTSDRSDWYKWKTSAGSSLIRAFFCTEHCTIMLRVSFTPSRSLNWKNVSSRPIAECFRVPDQNRDPKSVFFFFIILFFLSYGLSWPQKDFLYCGWNVELPVR